MSKKLIAVASAAALALSVLVGVAPASATAAAAFDTGIGNLPGATAATAATVPMPSTNILDTNFSGELDLTVVTGDTVRVETTGGVRVIESITGLGSSANAAVDVTKLGVTSWTKTYSTTTGAETVFVYTTSTAVGEVRVTITRPGLTYTNTLYLKGTQAGGNLSEYNIIDVTGVPATLAKGVKADITFKATDVFGNAVEDDAEVMNVNRVKVDGAAIAVAPTWDAAAKVYKASITSPSSSAFIVKLDAGRADITGLAAAVSQTFVVNNTTQAAVDAQVAALTAQLAASRPKANSVTKKRWNNLVLRHRALGGTAKLKR